MRKAIAVSVGGFPGANTALAELAAVTGELHHITIAATPGPSADVRFVVDLFKSKRARLLLLGGWSAAYEPLIAAATAAGVRVAVYWTSTAAQSEMGREMDRLTKVMEDPRVTYRWFAQQSLAKAVGRHLPGCAWLPNVVSALPSSGLPTPPRRSPRPPRQPVEIGLFCSPHEYHRKNVLTSLLAVASLASPYRLHLNGLSADAHYRGWLKRLGIHWVDHGWMTRADYLNTIAGLDIGLQVSFTESFNYVAADHILSGVPVVVSEMVAVMRELPASVRRPFVVLTPDEPGAIATMISTLTGRTAQTGTRIAAVGRALTANQRTRIAGVRRFFRKVLHP